MRKRIITVISLTLLAMFLIITVTTRVIIIDSFTDLERDYMEKDVARFMGALEETEEGLNNSVKDWAEWDETYAFIRNQNREYYENNLQGAVAFENLNVNIMLLADPSARVVYKKAVDLNTDGEMPFPPDLEAYLSSHPELLRHESAESSISGIILLSQAPMLVVSRAVLNSRGGGPIGGSLIMGRFLDTAELDKISDRNRLTLTLQALHSAGTPADFRQAEARIAGGPQVLVEPLGAASIAGYAILRDVSGAPVLMVRVESSRDIMNQGMRGVTYFTLSLAFIAVVFGLVMMLYMERILISRVHLLSAGVLSIGTSNNLSSRLSLAGKDEIAYLGAAINGMLDALERSTEELRRSEARNEALFAAVPDMILRLAGDGTLIDFRWPANTPLRPPPKGLVGLNARAIPAVFPFLPERIVERMLGAASESAASGNPQSFEFKTVEEDVELFFDTHVVASADGEAVVFIREITADKKAKEAQRKEILLKEIHHRVKNNLQVISSLLDLQARASKDEHVKALLHESQNRLRSMSLIHDKLYLAGETRGVSISEYVHDLALHLRASYAHNSEAVNMEVDVEDISVDMDIAVPCGLIINELASNALKYAFPDGRRGSIKISLRTGDDGHLVLTVSDDGVGVPAGVNPHSPTTLGLRIVNSLVIQLQGSLELDTAHGTAFILRFPRL
jgi:two-component sensor histidine kinase/sensor domain CHASE-containing protein